MVVILSGAKNLRSSLRVSCAKNPRSRLESRNCRDPSSPAAPQDDSLGTLLASFGPWQAALDDFPVDCFRLLL
jgi:hypothetical protein